MSVPFEVEDYLAHLAEPRREDMQTLHRTILGIAPACRLWFLDGKAKVTGYCIKFKRLGDVNFDTLQAAIRDGLEVESA